MAVKIRKGFGRENKKGFSLDVCVARIIVNGGDEMRIDQDLESSPELLFTGLPTLTL